MQVVLSAFDTDASLDVLDHPILNVIYYMVVYEACLFVQLFLVLFFKLFYVFPFKT